MATASKLTPGALILSYAEACVLLDFQKAGEAAKIPVTSIANDRKGLVAGLTKATALQVDGQGEEATIHITKTGIASIERYNRVLTGLAKAVKALDDTRWSHLSFAHMHRKDVADKIESEGKKGDAGLSSALRALNKVYPAGCMVDVMASTTDAKPATPGDAVITATMGARRAALEQMLADAEAEGDEEAVANTKQLLASLIPA